MPVTFRIPTYLASFAGDHTCLTVSGSPSTVADALQALWQLHPALRDRVLDEQGEVRQHINIFVGNECIRFTGGLTTPVPDGSELLIVPAVSGGSFYIG
jgi:molybdopterin converting factor small subunit